MKSVRNFLGEAGVAKAKRKLKDASAYEFLFPRAKGETITIKRNAGVKHTVKFIPQVVKETTNETQGIARTLLAETLYQTCKNIWQWVYDHIKYEKDETGKEQVRSPVRMFWDRKGDCDCFTTFIDSVLVNVSRMKKWPLKIVNRITKYSTENFQHIYPIVITPEGKRIVLDCVTEHFNYEEAYSEKQDHVVMDLEYLNGVDSCDMNDHLCDEEEESTVVKAEREADDLGKLKKSGRVKKAVHSVNRVNPATVALRNGLLLAMKLNVLNVAGRLKWSYLSEAKAREKKLKMDRWTKTKMIRERLEKIFYGAGGMPQNLREAILTGKGNKHNDVSGLGVVPIYSMEKNGMSIRDLIGAELYDKENAGLSGLGVVTEASLAAATAALATLSQLLKQIGPVKDSESDSDNPDASGENVPPDETAPVDNPKDDSGNDDADKNKNTDNKNDDTRFLDDPLTWMKNNPGKTAIGAAAIAALVYGGYKMISGKDEEEKAIRSPQSSPISRSRSREEVEHMPLV